MLGYILFLYAAGYGSCFKVYQQINATANLTFHTQIKAPCIISKKVACSTCIIPGIIMFYWLDNLHLIFSTSESLPTVMIDDVAWFRNTISLTSYFQLFVNDGNVPVTFKGRNIRFNYEEEKHIRLQEKSKENWAM